MFVGSQETGSQTASSTPSRPAPLSKRHPFRSVEAIRKQSLGCNFLPTELSKIEPVLPSSFRLPAQPPERFSPGPTLITFARKSFVCLRLRRDFEYLIGLPHPCQPGPQNFFLRQNRTSLSPASSCVWADQAAAFFLPNGSGRMEMTGFEPVTSCLQSTRSPN